MEHNKLGINLLESGSLFRKSYLLLVENASKAIALITLVVSAIILFTDITFQSFDLNTFTPTLLLMLVASYLMYFSMEDAGERLYMQDEKYLSLTKKLEKLKGEIAADALARLRKFCTSFSREERDFRLENFLLTKGYSVKEYLLYKEHYAKGRGEKKRKGANCALTKISDTAVRADNTESPAVPADETAQCCERSDLKNKSEELYATGFKETENEAVTEKTKKPEFSKAAIRTFKRADRIKPVEISLSTLLNSNSKNSKSELRDPQKSKFCFLALKMIPTSVCMILTVSVMLTVKESLTAGTVMDALLKLSTLPIIGFRGYSTGYNFHKFNTVPWLETKIRLIEAFLCQSEKESSSYSGN